MFFKPFSLKTTSLKWMVKLWYLLYQLPHLLQVFKFVDTNSKQSIIRLEESFYPHQAEDYNLGNNLSGALRGLLWRGREEARMYMNFLARK